MYLLWACLVVLTRTLGLSGCTYLGPVWLYRLWKWLAELTLALLVELTLVLLVVLTLALFGCTVHTLALFGCTYLGPVWLYSTCEQVMYSMYSVLGWLGGGRGGEEWIPNYGINALDPLLIVQR